MLRVFGLVVLLAAQTASRSFTVEQILGFPSPDNLIASPVGSTIAWTFNERGVRNIYVAGGPAFEARRVTSYTDDDGQELSRPSLHEAKCGDRPLRQQRANDDGSSTCHIAEQTTSTT